MPPLKPFSLWISTGERAGLVTVLKVENGIVTARWLTDRSTFQVALAVAQLKEWGVLKPGVHWQ